MKTQQPHCRLCYRVIAPFDPDRDESGKYHVSCMKRLERHRLATMYVMSLFLCVLLVGCASAPSPQAGDKWVRGCTAMRNQANGNMVYERAVVVGVTPQGASYWMNYPDRNVPEGEKQQAELMSVDTFKRIFRRICPPGMWGASIDLEQPP